MNDADLSCRSDLRRLKLREHNPDPMSPRFFGLDFLEVGPDQRTLTVWFVGQAPRKPIVQEKSGLMAMHRHAYDLTRDNVRITGGRRVRDLQIVHFEVVPATQPDGDDRMVIRVDRAGDFSPYSLRLVKSPADAKNPDAPPIGFDPRYAHLDFNFKVDCPNDLDCKPAVVCPPPARREPEINYLAKDYASFRQAILDRLSIVMPEWNERHAPDLGIALVELLAYVGDYLSYYQDAVATEAYLGTARQRISVRRHARLVDYVIHEGCNARVWVAVTTNEDGWVYARDLWFLTALNQPPSTKGPNETDCSQTPKDTVEVFQPVVLAAEEQRLGLTPADIVDVAKFIKELSDRTNLVSTYLTKHFSSLGSILVKKKDPEGTGEKSTLLTQLLAELNDLIYRREDFYNSDRFNALPLSKEVQLLADRKPDGWERQLLNRWLLEEAYPNHVLSARRLYFSPARNRISFYTWGEQECCLPKGTTSATLVDDGGPPPGKSAPTSWGPEQGASPSRQGLRLKPGDVLIFEEVLGPKTGAPGDADPTHRHAVRLTKVTHDVIDPLFKRRLVEIEWHSDDALPFALCLSSIVPEQQCQLLTDVSVAWGNVVLADHGRPVAQPEKVGTVASLPPKSLCSSVDNPQEQAVVAAPIRPRLKEPALTFHQPLTTADLIRPASSMLEQDPRKSVPALRLSAMPQYETWLPRPDLIDSGPRDRHVVVEVDNAGVAQMRFGDDELGRRPRVGQSFSADYRFGTGPEGNVGAEAVCRVCFIRSATPKLDLTVRNPLPARGGTAPEPIDEVRVLAPFAFRNELLRAVTAADYGALAGEHARVQRAAASLRWMGSWYEVVTAIDPRGQADASHELLASVADHLEPYRRVGHDLVMERARYVPLDVKLRVCVLPHYQRGHVKAALLDRLSNRRLPDGRLGLFHPDNWTFGQDVSTSALVSSAMGVEGVSRVEVTLRRLFEGPERDPLEGVLRIGPLEVARLDNDPSAGENGLLTLDMRGGR